MQECRAAVQPPPLCLQPTLDINTILELNNVDDDDDNQPTLVFQAGVLHLHDPILIQKFSYLDTRWNQNLGIYLSTLQGN